MSEKQLDILLVEGAKIDRCRTKNEKELIERVWEFSKPPVFYAKPTVSVRKQEVMRHILRGDKDPCQLNNLTSNENLTNK